jgi:TonB family protein
MTVAGISTLLICDGNTTWTYLPSRNQYQKSDGVGGSCLTSPMRTWTLLLDGLESAAITGRDTVEFQGKPTPCEVVLAKYSKLPAGASLPGGGEISGAGTRTFCIDRQRSMILRDRVETGLRSPAPNAKPVATTATILYSNIERAPQLPADLFVFHPPPGSSVLGARQPSESRGPLPPGAAPPVLISKQDPVYTQAARDAKIQGDVLLSVEIDPEGIPRNMQVARSLDPGLDQRAIEAVSKWRFRPGMKDGKPVSVRVHIEVNFRLI